MKAQANMVSRTSSSKPVAFAAFAASVEERRAQAGVTEFARNSGTRRTGSKIALLSAIGTAGGVW